MNVERLIQKIYNRRPARILLHIVFWILLSIVQWHLTSISFNPNSAFPDHVAVLMILANIFSIALFYYLFVYVVLSKVISKKRYVFACVLTLLLVVIYGLSDVFKEEWIIKDCVSCMDSLQSSNTGYFHFLQTDLSNRLFLKIASLGTIIGLLFSIALPLSIKLGMQALRQQFRSMQLAKENLQLEFNFLRSQVNPHFLFNSLNNIYGLILNDDKNKSADLVARLSQFLRYTLYESENDKTPIDKEVQLLKDYIDLESIRMNYTKASFNYQTDNSMSNLPSLLMIPVVENAFKYCADNSEAYINIHFQIQNKQVSFTVKNTIDPDRQSATVGGIGLANFRKRLQLYYPGLHQYKVTNSEQEYAVSINIDCHERD
jgi:sensor histidine kinase YesM